MRTILLLLSLVTGEPCDPSEMAPVCLVLVFACGFTGGAFLIQEHPAIGLTIFTISALGLTKIIADSHG